MLVAPLLVIGGLLALGLMTYGVLAEANSKTYAPEDDLLQGIMQDTASDHPRQFAFNVEHISPTRILVTLFWLIWLIPLVDHLQDTRFSTTSQVVWALTIGPHEMGHVIFMPFSELIMFLGGTIWQILFWILLALWVFFVRKQPAFGSMLIMVTGHSFINASVYIADAQERALPLLFGMDGSHHDWWNILTKLNMLEYDNQIASVFLVIGVLIVLGVIFINIGYLWRGLIGIRNTEEKDSAQFIGENNQPII